MSHMPTLLAACPFKCTHCLLDEEKKRCRYVQSASGFVTGSTRRWLIIETDTVRWEAFIIDMFKGEQTSVGLVISKGFDIWASNTHRCCNDSRLLLWISLFFLVESFSTIIINIWFVIMQSPHTPTYILMHVSFNFLIFIYSIWCILSQHVGINSFFLTNIQMMKMSQKKKFFIKVVIFVNSQTEAWQTSSKALEQNSHAVY